MNWRKLHKKVSLVITLPLLVVVISGFFLQFRNTFEWIQPKVVSAPVTGQPLIGFNEILAKHTIDPTKLDQIIYQAKKNIIIVRWPDGRELQLHPQTGEVMKEAVRRTAFFIELHQGSLFGPLGQFGLYVLTSFGLFFLIISGIQMLWPRRRS